MRETDEFCFKIEFLSKKFSYILKENNLRIEDKIECEINFDSISIDIKYKLDDEEKNILIQFI